MSKTIAFLKRNWGLVFALAYLILPDFIPGPIDDIFIIMAERMITARKERRDEEESSK